MGGIGFDNDCVKDCWFYNLEKNILERVDELAEGIDWDELRGARGVGMRDGKYVYILAGSNTKKYKAV